MRYAVMNDNGMLQEEAKIQAKLLKLLIMEALVSTGYAELDESGRKAKNSEISTACEDMQIMGDYTIADITGHYAQMHGVTACIAEKFSTYYRLSQSQIYRGYRGTLMGITSLKVLGVTCDTAEKISAMREKLTIGTDALTAYRAALAERGLEPVDITQTVDYSISQNIIISLKH